MLLVVSPAKNLDYETPAVTDVASQPRMLEDAEVLVERARELSPQELGSLMKISDKLAGLNAARFSEWQQPFTAKNAKQAVFAFNGDVYSGLDAQTLTTEAIEYAQAHLRILSGLYGVLRPLDLMQAYRLEMGTKLSNPRGKDLYEFWGDKITEQLNADIRTSGDDFLLNLASNEYFKSVNKSKLEVPLVTPVFKDTKNGQLKVISFYAKKARGMMARYVLENQVTTVAGLQAFDAAGYQFNGAMSSDDAPVFTRAEQVK
ncbi:MAG: peroxide stress protein YaaA [Idiomarina sp.]|nr:peroxide stress protein YaaA [Idiomarina sp.]